MCIRDSPAHSPHVLRVPYGDVWLVALRSLIDVGLWSGIDKMTEKSPASSIHSVEPLAASYDGSDTAEPVNNDPTMSGGDASSGQADSLPTAEASPECSQPTDDDAAAAAESSGEADKLRLSTLKEQTVVSSA